MSLYRHVITSRRWDPQPCCCGTLVAHGEAHYCCVAFSGLVVRLVEGLPGLARPGKVRASPCGYRFGTELQTMSPPNRCLQGLARTFPGLAGPGRPLPTKAGSGFTGKRFIPPGPGTLQNTRNFSRPAYNHLPIEPLPVPVGFGQPTMPRELVGRRPLFDRKLGTPMLA